MKQNGLRAPARHGIFECLALRGLKGVVAQVCDDTCVAVEHHDVVVAIGRGLILQRLGKGRLGLDLAALIGESANETVAARQDPGIGNTLIEVRP